MYGHINKNRAIRLSNREIKTINVKFLQGKVCKDLVCAMDILPTFLELMGVEINDDEMLDAKSLIPLLTSDTLGPNRKNLLINDTTGRKDCTNDIWGPVSAIHNSK